MNFYLLTKDSSESSNLSVPVLWCTLKTYYEENSSNAHKWDWCSPFLGRQSYDEILETLRESPPDVFGFNIYVWNEHFQDTFAQIVKQEFPNCLIVYGGPQQNIKYNTNYFKEKSWVDIVLPYDAYGEVVLTAILDNYPIQDFSQIPYIYYTNSDREWFMSNGVIEKKTFNWPSNIFKAQEQYILPALLEKRAANEVTVAYYHTTRGCPYKCIYCSWGGGTNTKAIKKPYTTILDEVEWLAGTAKINRIEFSDANFGISAIDIEIARFCVELNKKYNFPQTVDVEPAKNNLKRVLQIEELLLDAGMLSMHRMAIQSLDPIVGENIQRVNMPFDDQVIGLRYMQSRPNGNLPLYIEAIIGLPGERYDTICEQLDQVYRHNIPIGWIHHYGWMLLPESPAYSPAMREQFKIKTVKQWINQNPKLKTGFTVKNGDALNLVGELPTKSVETVVGTYSYSSEEWMRMFRLSNFTVAGHIAGINLFLLEYIVNTYNVKPSQVLTDILNYIDGSTGIQDAELRRLFDLEKTTLTNWLHTASDAGVDIDAEFPFLMSHHCFFAFIILMHADVFYKEISRVFAAQYNDDKILDLGKYIANSLIDFTYDGTIGREFKTEYDWLNYFNNSAILVKGAYEYVIDDPATTWSTDKIDKLLEYYHYSVRNNLNPQPKIGTTLRLK